MNELELISLFEEEPEEKPAYNFGANKVRMNELTIQERDALDELNRINQKFEKDKEKSLWNVCEAYLQGKFSLNILNLDQKEIEAILKEINESRSETKLTRHWRRK